MTNTTGLLFQVQRTKGIHTLLWPKWRIWRRVKRIAINAIKEQGFPATFIMPCGSKVYFTQQDIKSLPIHDIPCRCGDPTHWLVRFVEW